jgi:hypothetical protein
MLNDWTHIEPAARLQAMNRALDRMVPESPHESFGGTIAVMLEAVAQQEMTKASTTLEEAVQANPFWLRGYLLLAAVYESAEQSTQAIASIERGLDRCAQGLRLYRAPRWVRMVEQINGPVAHERIRRNLERFKRYDRIFRHRMAMMQIRCGSFDEAIEQWAAIDDEHCA